MPWELKEKKGPPNPVRAWPSPTCHALGIQRVQKEAAKWPSEQQTTWRPKSQGLETAGFGGCLQELRLWAPRNSRDSPHKHSSHLQSFPSGSDRDDERDQCPFRPLLETRHQGGVAPSSHPCHLLCQPPHWQAGGSSVAVLRICLLRRARL